MKQCNLTTHLIRQIQLLSRIHKPNFVVFKYFPKKSLHILKSFYPFILVNINQQLIYQNLYNDCGQFTGLHCGLRVRLASLSTYTTTIQPGKHWPPSFQSDLKLVSHWPMSAHSDSVRVPTHVSIPQNIRCVGGPLVSSSISRQLPNDNKK